jgi:alkaline phosphatase
MRPPTVLTARLALAHALATLVLAAPALAAGPRAGTLASGAGAPAAAPRSVILMIADGCGPSHLALARMVAGRPLALDSILTGMVTTGAADSRVTDSGAGATAYATGVKTFNHAIAVDTLRRPLGTLLEAAEAAGLATGLVATSRITHATPAAFAAHVAHRDAEDVIAEQMLAQGIEVILGGGRRHFVARAAGGQRRDRRDLLAESRARGAVVVIDAAGLAAADRTPLVGLFGMDHLDYALDGDSLHQPRLATMTARALALLARAPRGFFLMVEGSRVDHAAHDNDPAATTREALEYDAAVRVAIDFARRDGRTLVVSVADHETGGLTLGRRVGAEGAADVHPEALSRVRRSSRGLAARLRAGADPDSLMRADAGLGRLSGEERTMLAEGVAGRRGLEGTIGEIVSRRALIGWTTNGHTAAEVTLHAYGPGRERFTGLLDNTDVARRIAALQGLDLGAVTARLRAAR